jgi:tetracycline resistance efflux pump
MHSPYGVLSLVPSLLAIVLALTTRRVLPALLAGVVCAMTLASSGSLPAAPARTIDRLIATAADPDTMRLIVFSLLIGSLLKLLKDSGAFEVVPHLLARSGRRYGRRTAFGLTWAFGVALILETWSNVLISGTTLGAVYDRLRISRERLAYFIHSIGINVVALALINSWGAFYMALLASQGIDDPLAFLVRSVPYFLYSWVSLAVVAAVMIGNVSIGPMRVAEERVRANATSLAAAPVATFSTDAAVREPRARHMLTPLAVLIGGVVISMWITGDGNIAAGDGSAAVLYAAAAAILVQAALLRIDGTFDLVTIEQKILAGMAEFLDVAILIVLALALGGMSRELGAGAYLAQILQGSIAQAALPALIFVTGAAISFATGTSYGTFSIMVPIALPLAAATGTSPELLFGACIAGGVFGDNCSPISDTTIVSGVGANVPAIEHARTQLPYALIAAGLSAAGYLVLGVM